MLPDFTAPFKRLRLALRRAPLPPPASSEQPCLLTHPDVPLPEWVAQDPLVQKYRSLLGVLPWAEFPERSTERAWPGPSPERRAPFVAA